jgi:hypothetical protein
MRLWTPFPALKKRKRKRHGTLRMWIQHRKLADVQSGGRRHPLAEGRKQSKPSVLFPV